MLRSCEKKAGHTGIDPDAGAGEGQDRKKEDPLMGGENSFQFQKDQSEHSLASFQNRT